MKANPLTRLRIFIANAYDLGDFRLLCTDLSILYDDLGGDERISVKADRLLYLIGQQRRYGELLAVLRRTRKIAFEQGGFNGLAAEELQDALPVYAGEQVVEPGHSRRRGRAKKVVENGRYQIKEEIGRGSFAVVYKAYDTVLDREVAYKVLHPYWHDKTEFVGRFNLEARTAAKLSHLNIIKVYDSGQDENGQLFMVMEYVAGQSLDSYLKDREGLSIEEALVILEQVAAALDYAHAEGVVHRDVKPGNIMINEGGPEQGVYLTDFGLVKAMEGTLAETMTVQATNLGSPEYMSPEQADPHHEAGVGPAADRYALGVLAYRLLTGQVPFSGANWMATLYGHVHLLPPEPRKIRSELVISAEQALLKVLAKAPDNRFDSCHDFISALTRPPQNIWVNPKTGKEMVWVPAGSFLFGVKVEQRELAEFWIDKTPVTNAEYARFVTEKRYEPPSHWKGRMEPPSELADHPVVYVSRGDAEKYAKWAGGNLPSEEQWEKAARGTDGNQYPWGDEWQEACCNSEEASIGETSLVGRFSPVGDSPYGCVDMSGNVWEWTSTNEGEYYWIKGGSYNSGKNDVRVAARLIRYIRWDNSRGFRIVVPAPFSDHDV